MRQTLLMLALQFAQSGAVRNLQGLLGQLLLPLRILLSGLLARLLQLLLNLSDLRDQPTQLVTQGAALAFQLRQFVAALFQRLARGGDVERLVLTDRRMLVRTTQRAGFAGLQLGAVGFQILNALLLFKQLFLVGLLLLERLVTLAQAGDFIVLAGVLLLQLSQTRGQLGDLCSRLLTALRQLFQTIQYAPLHLQLLPTLAQSGLDLTTASQNAAAAMQANLQSGEATRLVGGLGDIFNTASDFYKKSEEERVRRQTEQNYGQTLYSPYYSYGSGRG